MTQLVGLHGWRDTVFQRLGLRMFNTSLKFYLIFDRNIYESSFLNTDRLNQLLRQLRSWFFFYRSQLRIELAPIVNTVNVK